MHNHTPINLDIVATVAQALGDLNTEVVYIGGAVISIYATDEGAELPRVTTDVDVCVQVSTLNDMETLRERLAEKNIFPDATGTHLYRYTHKGILIDFIPYEATPFGPTNSYLKPGFEQAYETQVGSVEISVLPVTVFLATKWEAFNDRGGSDPRWSHDFEDIIYILDNNTDLLEHAKVATTEVINALKALSTFILEHSNSREIIECHISPITAQERGEFITEKLTAITNL
ncbi:nucleotidyl transferase AbiEii/AbiGii toxin family protein [Winogradskyella sp. PC D3.3]